MKDLTFRDFISVSNRQARVGILSAVASFAFTDESMRSFRDVQRVFSRVQHHVHLKTKRGNKPLHD